MTEPGKRRAIFSIRYLLYFFSWLCMWQGWHVSGSIFQMNFITDLLPASPLYLHEIILLMTFALLIVERMISGDLTFTRSYFSGPILLMGFALVFSWINGMVIRQEFSLVYEAHESILIVISFFIFINIFRSKEERKLLLVLFFCAMIMKAADSTWIKFFSSSPEKGWGTVLFWRDGFLLGMGVTGTLILAHYKGKQLKWLRTMMFCFTPLIMYGLIVSYRRTFFLALFVSAIIMFYSVGKGRRRTHAFIFLMLIIAIIVYVVAIDPIGIIARTVGGVLQPQEEGSSYIRLIEYPNILQNIYHNPIFGVPIGVQWFQYYRMPIFANYTTVGCHNTYLYWPLRTGIIGTFAFFWLLARTWKAIIVNIVIQKTEEDFLMNQFLLHCMITYNFASFFGLMYSDAMSILTSFILVMVQLQMIHEFGLISYRRVNLWQTIRQKKIVYRTKPPLLNFEAS
jgi:O-antigen ligase